MDVFVLIIIITKNSIINSNNIVDNMVVTSADIFVLQSYIQVQCICESDRCLVFTKHVSTDSQSRVYAYCYIELKCTISFSNFAQTFSIVVPHKESAFNRILLKASQCHPKCHFLMVHHIFARKCSTTCNILSNFVFTLHVVIPL